MEDLEKLEKRADKIFRKRERKIYLLLKACEAGLIRKPVFKKRFLREEMAYCPECGHKLNNLYHAYISCPNCEYEYWSSIPN